MTRRHAFTGSPYEAQFGFARAVREGNRIIVAGTGPVEDDGSSTADQDAVGAVHARFFGEARPAATMAGIAWLCRPEWKVEMEAEALLGLPPSR